MAHSRSSKQGRRINVSDEAGRTIFWIAVFLLFSVPLTFSTALHRIFTLPRFVLLLTGSAVLAPLLIMEIRWKGESGDSAVQLLRSPLAYIAAAYLLAITVSTAFGLAPISSLIGTFENQMGLISYLCFFICFIALIVGIGRSERRLNQALRAMTIAGLITSIYSLFQFVGADPLLPAAAYTFDYGSGPVVRPVGTIGHADYLGNFLLYTSPISLALAIRGRGRERRLGFAAFGLSLAAILVSGTRGAWVGIVAGLGVLAAFEFRKTREWLKSQTQTKLILGGGLTLVLIVTLAIAVGPGRAAKNIVDRGRSVVSEGFSGSGRTLLWKDSLRMVPRYALIGCGPEAFKEALLSYKSKALAMLAPSTNNESSHNSYIDASVSYGLPGAALYVAMFAAMLLTALRARKSVLEPRSRWIPTGIIASVIAVAVHNFFIFDQIPTGLYFFALAAISEAASNVAGAATSQLSRAGDYQLKPARPSPSPGKLATVIITGLFVVPALWYSIALLNADVNLEEAYAASRVGNYQQLQSAGTAAASAPDPTGSYHFMFARALSDFVDRAALTSTGDSQSSDSRSIENSTSRSAAIALAIDQAKQALPHNLEQDSIYLLLAYLEGLAGNVSAEIAYAQEALARDPQYANAHLMMGRAYLAKGDLKAAATEGYAARELDPTLPFVESLIANAGGEFLGGKEFPVSEMLPKAQKLLAAANLSTDDLNKALRIAKRAVRREPNNPLCHRTLAQAYEQARNYRGAIAEWRSYLNLAPGQAQAEHIPEHIEALTKSSSIPVSKDRAGRD